MKDKNKLPVVLSLRLSAELDSELAKMSDKVERKLGTREARKADGEREP